ncbi:MAG: ATP-binding protein [Gammaproteobacteria bacterium]|nr:ATP-binding protein [Gammaproteobacteria bacterium]
MAKKHKIKLSLEAKVTVLSIALTATAVAVTAAIAIIFESLYLRIVFSLAIAAPLSIYLVHRFMRPINKIVQALSDGVASFRDGDFSISLGTDRNDELGALVDNYNAVGDILRRERQNLFQRELLLDTVIQSTPTALVLTSAADKIVYSNTAARRLFNNGKKIEGYTFPELLSNDHEQFREAVENDLDGLFTVEIDDEEEVFHLSHGRFTLNARHHHLYLFKQMTKELNRQEVATWKKVIRVISHELNNTLAPISSLAHSGHIIAEQHDIAKLDKIFSTIEERAAFLNTFIDGYARFAKLPNPQPVKIDWREFLDSVREVVPFLIAEKLPDTPGVFDPVQMQQVLINLLKNAHESGSAKDAVQLKVKREGASHRIEILDRGSGMRDQVLKNALLPFYSTKTSGTGLGLPLCREIIEAHGGRLSIANRAGGGLAVTVWLPHSRAAMTSARMG